MKSLLSIRNGDIGVNFAFLLPVIDASCYCIAAKHAKCVRIFCSDICHRISVENSIN